MPTRTTNVHAVSRNPATRRLTRREVVAGATLASLRPAIAAHAQTPSASPATSAFPRTVTDALGNDVTIPAPPKHVHTARNASDFDTALALGVVPVSFGTTSGEPLREYQVSAGGQENGIDTTDGVDIEMLLVREVDLVVIVDALFDLVPDEITLLRQLGVPIVALPGTDIAGQLTILGEALGRESVAAERLAAHEEAIASFTPAIQPRSLTIMGLASDTDLALYTPLSPIGILVEQLGLPALAFPTEPMADREEFALVSVEAANTIDAEYVLGLEYWPGALDTMENLPVFPAIPAVAAGRYRRIDPGIGWAFGTPNVLTAPVIFDALAGAFAS